MWTTTFAVALGSASARYTLHKGLNCYSGCGGLPVDPQDPIRHAGSLAECENLCSSTAGCAAITTSIDNLCWLRSSVDLGRCIPGTAYDTYTVSGSPGPSLAPTSAPPPPPPSPPSPPSPVGWKLTPIEVRGQHLYNPFTNKTFHARGIAFPNLGDQAMVSDWVDVLKRIAHLSNNLNLVRLYTFPPCVHTSDCFMPFMKEADALGVYVLVPGTGVQDGYLPLSGFGGTAQGCYEQGNVLGLGKTVVQRFGQYPNTLAIVIGNEFLRRDTWAYASVLKAYARDLKIHQEMCNIHADSPAKNQMRRIPLIYAANDDYGDAGSNAKANYLFCGDGSQSVDMYGLNVERWCQPGPQTIYNSINAWVGKARYPGAFMFTEMGCFRRAFGGARDWAQVRGFFANFQHIDGFAACAYWNAGATDFNMFDRPGADAIENQDGKNFFSALDDVGDLAERSSDDPITPACATNLLGVPLQPMPHTYGGMDATRCPQPLPRSANNHIGQYLVV